MANWSDLPLVILCLFAKRLPSVEEFVRFGAVCRSWRAAATEAKKGRRFAPWLMLAEIDNDGTAEKGAIRSCYSFTSDRKFQLSLPRLQGRRCWGTDLGWLFTLGLDLEIFLFHPLTCAEIPLPSQSKFSPQTITDFQDNLHICGIFIYKVALSSNPSSASPVIMVATLEGLGLSFASPGDEKWTPVKTRDQIGDIVFFRNRFWCVGIHGELWVCNTDAAVPRTRKVADPPVDKLCDLSSGFYLVASSHKLYLINRKYELYGGNEDEFDDSKPPYITECFSAYKFNFREKKWGTLRRHLGGYALFLGNIQSFFISPSDYPKFMPDCIYYTDDNEEWFDTDYSDMGIYDYKRRVLVRSFDNCDHQPSDFSRSVFFMPQLT